MAKPNSRNRKRQRRERKNAVSAATSSNGAPSNHNASSETEFTAVTENKKATKDNGDTVPLEVGTSAKCRWRDEKVYPVKVLERRKLKNSERNDYEYYIHYIGFKSRLDEWVKLEQLELVPVETVADEKVGDKVASLIMTRSQKRKTDRTHMEAHEELDTGNLSEHEEFSVAKNIITIELGRYEMETWYFSPFPAEYNDCRKLYFCEFCLNYMSSKEQLQRHMKKCNRKYPPGNEIYRDGNRSLFEVDGEKERVYGENLCLLAKLFLDKKNPYSDVGLFLFYILTEYTERGCHIVGYFSKEKHSEHSFNLACILTLPPYQKKGHGKFLIAFCKISDTGNLSFEYYPFFDSCGRDYEEINANHIHWTAYELSKKEGKVGTPEKPLSDLGKVSYEGYWTQVLLDILKKHKGSISIKELSDMTAIMAEDILTTLNNLKLIQNKKGRQIICKDPKVLDRHLKAFGSRLPAFYIGKLQWTPYKEQS